MEANKTPGQKPHALRGTALRNTKERTQVDRKSAHTLLEHCSQEVGLEGQRTHVFGVQAIKGVVALIVVPFEPTGKSPDRFENPLLRDPAIGRDGNVLTNRCRRTCHFPSWGP